MGRIASSLEDFHVWQRNDESATRVAVSCLLRQDLVRKIPGQQQNVIRLALHQRIRRHYRQLRPWSELALFLCRSICDEIEQVTADSEEVEEGRSFRRRAIRGDVLTA